MGIPLKNDTHALLTHLEEVDAKKPSDIIIRQIKKLIHDGVLQPGDKLPAERILQDKFGVGRGQVREAIKKLEFYGILQTLPQSGTIVASLGVKSLEGLIANVLSLEKDDFQSLLETRRLLELEATRLTTIYATDEEISVLENAQNDFYVKVNSGQPGLDEDLAIHLKIAEFCRNSVLWSIITLITPDIIKFAKSLNTCSDGRYKIALEEHDAVLESIKQRDPDKAVSAMRSHLDRTLEVSSLAYKKRMGSIGNG